MRLRHCVGAVLLLAVSAPAMADMYLFDGRAWISESHTESDTRAPAGTMPLDNAQIRIANTMFTDPVRAIRLTRDSLRDTLLPRRDSNARPAP
jgi:hypothetical protein